MNKKEQNKSEREIDIIPLLKALLSKLWVMLLAGFIVALVVFGATKLTVKPTYRCGFTAYVNNQRAQSSDKTVLTNQDLVAAQQLTKTYSHIICSNSVLSASLKSINSDLTYNDFSKMVSTEIQDETELISVYVVNQDPQDAYELANAVANTAPKYMSQIVEGSSMKIVDYPVYSDKRYKPSYVKYAFFGFLFGVLTVAVIFIIRYFKDDTVKDDSELEAFFSLPVLGVVPDVNASGKSGYGYYNSYGYERSSKPERSESKNENV